MGLDDRWGIRVFSPPRAFIMIEGGYRLLTKHRDLQD